MNQFCHSQKGVLVSSVTFWFLLILNQIIKQKNCFGHFLMRYEVKLEAFNLISCNFIAGSLEIEVTSMFPAPLASVSNDIQIVKCKKK